MKTQTYNKKCFKEIVSNTPSGFMEAQVKNRTDRKNKLRSFKVALSILEILDYKKMSQVALAEKVDVTPQQISKWLNGRSNMTLGTIEKIENAIGYQLIEVRKIDFERELRKKEFVQKDFKERIIKGFQSRQAVQGRFTLMEDFSFMKRSVSKCEITFKEAEENLKPVGS